MGLSNLPQDIVEVVLENPRTERYRKKKKKNLINEMKNLQKSLLIQALMYLYIILCSLILQVSEGRTGHTEAVKVIYDKRKISYKTLCDLFWEIHDPTNRNFLVTSHLPIISLRSNFVIGILNLVAFTFFFYPQILSSLYRVCTFFYNVILWVEFLVCRIWKNNL